MKPIVPFEEYVKMGIVKTQYPDFSRTNSLKKDAANTLELLREIVKKIGISNENANSIIKISYDIMMYSIRALMYQKGFQAAGSSAHEAEVVYLRILNFKEQDVQFADQLRDSRNRIMYHGKSFNKEYAEKVLQFLEKIYPQLKGE